MEKGFIERYFYPLFFVVCIVWILISKYVPEIVFQIGMFVLISVIVQWSMRGKTTKKAIAESKHE